MDETLSNREPSEPRRKRASKACLSCRARKVRCDVAHRGIPCMNCFLDKQECIVKARLKKYRKGSTASDVAPKSNGNGRSHLTDTSSEQSRDLSRFQRSPSQIEASTNERTDDISMSAGRRDSQVARPQGISDLLNHERCTATFSQPTIASLDAESQSLLQTHLDSMSTLSPHNINFLEAQGCFRIPTRPILDEFIREYFLHIHPILPIINERRFWEIYSSSNKLGASPGRTSVFVFQAMMFAASSFLLLTSVQQLGFTHNRSARNSYYRRAKLLFDFDTESCAIALSQGTLLLSYHSPMLPHKKSNTYWLGTAIHFAKVADAHQYESLQNISNEKRNTLKRLWWCCVLRDRILPLGVRKSLQISSNDFDFRSTPLMVEDFDNEIPHSEVYDASTKLGLVKFVVCLCELAVPLTDTIMLLYPLSNKNDIDHRQSSNFDEMARCKRTLRHWFQKTIVNCALPAVDQQHESLVLYSNLMYMCYHSAMMALCHHEVLMTASDYGNDRTLSISQSKKEIEGCVSAFTESLKEVVQLKVAKYMPISVVAYAALPLVLHLLDIKLANMAFQKATRQRRLNIYTEAMTALQTQYDVTDMVSDSIRNLIQHISLEQEGAEITQTPQSVDSTPGNYKSDDNSSSVVNSWGDVFLRQPTLYLRLTYTIDFYLSKTIFPEERDFPPVLQSRTKSQTSFPSYRIRLGNTISPADGALTSQVSSPVPVDFKPISKGQINLDAMEFDDSTFELPMGFEAFDMDMFIKRRMDFENPQAWVDEADQHT